MMEASYKVTTTRGGVYVWKFTEYKSENDYGNGIYIGIKTPTGEIFSLDCRYYTNYKFRKACEEYLSEYYGANLATITPNN